MLPATLARLEFTSLHIEDNPRLRFPPQDIVSNGVEATLDYLKSVLSNTETTTVHRLRLFILSTSKCNRLQVINTITRKWKRTHVFHDRSSPRVLQDSESPRRSGEGVSTTDYTFLHRKVPYTIHLCDLSNLDILQYPFFFSSKGSTILLIHNVDKNPFELLDNYFVTIKIQVSFPDILLVAVSDKTWDRPKKEKMEHLCSKWARAFSITIFFVSYADESGNQLATEFSDSLVERVGAGVIVPSIFLLLEQLLQDLRDQMTCPVLSMREFTATCSLCMPPDKVNDCGTLLHYYGSIVYDKLKFSKEFVILDPLWLHGIIKSALESKPQQKGILQHCDLVRTYKGLSEEMHTVILSLLMAVGVAFPMSIETKILQKLFPREGNHSRKDLRQYSFRKDSFSGPIEQNIRHSLSKANVIGVSLVPTMVPSIQPESLSQWPSECPSGQHQLVRIFKFTFLPSTLFPRIMVKILEQATHIACVWRHGLLCVLDSAQILLQVLTVDGDNIQVASQVPNQIKITSRADDQYNCILAMESVKCIVHRFLTDWDALSYDYLILTSYRSQRIQLSLYTLLDVLMSGKEAKVMAPVEKPKTNKGITAFDLLAEEPQEESEGLDIMGFLVSQEKEVPLDLNVETISQLAPELAIPGINRLNNVIIGDVIALGGFSCIYKGKLDGEDVAIKKVNVATERMRMPSQQAAFTEERNDFLQIYTKCRGEMLTIHQYRHQNVLELKGLTLDPLCMVYELAPHGDLLSAIEDTSRDLPWEFRLRVLYDVSQALQHLHCSTPCLVHLDVKCPNVILMSFDPSATVVAKIIDFEMSRPLYPGMFLEDRYVDNPTWLAPEIMLGVPYDEKVDVYGFGLICYELMSRQQFFPPSLFLYEIESSIISGYRPAIRSEVCPKKFGKIIQMCWDKDPTNRPDMGTVSNMLRNLLHYGKKWTLKHGKRQAEEQTELRNAMGDKERRMDEVDTFNDTSVSDDEDDDEDEDEEASRDLDSSFSELSTSPSRKNSSPLKDSPRMFSISTSSGSLRERESSSRLHQLTRQLSTSESSAKYKKVPRLAILGKKKKEEKEKK
eukprot:TRINITY_DN4940_c0_g1_i1.p1 TRINITY_DN4940_c0_g1~~TRINITY_DN4940_c0_g1_i1.p1  ORF type:complete len:1069 (-),score=128.38 TRINITY_DN4940_c0_g1_i1:122-3328(-)